MPKVVDRHSQVEGNQIYNPDIALLCWIASGSLVVIKLYEVTQIISNIKRISLMTNGQDQPEGNIPDL